MNSKLLAGVSTIVVMSICLSVGNEFRRARADETLFPSSALTSRVWLSEYHASLRGTRGDTEIFEYTARDSGGTVLILGGTHCDEPASYIAAYLLVENLLIEQGRVLLVPRANRSALSHNTPGEAHPPIFEFKTTNGLRTFRMGSRYTNPLDQWPDPEVFVHFPSGQELSGADSRNLNRCYPGREDGRFTEQIAFALTELVRRERVDLVIDLHEASLEYPVINAIIAHERAMDCAANAVLELQTEGLDFALEPSPKNFHGLSHRELGDHSPTHATLMESANAIQGRLRGRTNAELILTGRDPMYERAATINMTRVPYDEQGIPLEVRVGRHLTGCMKLIESFSMLQPTRTVKISGIPAYAELQEQGLGHYLDPSATP